jgi:hypothetical protein
LYFNEAFEVNAQKDYKVANDSWLKAIRVEEELALAESTLTVAEVDNWERAHFQL